MKCVRWHRMALGLAALSGSLLARGQDTSAGPPRPARLQALYLSLGTGKALNLSDARSAIAGLTFFLKNGWGAAGRFRTVQYTAVALPADYQAGSGGFSVFKTDPTPPQDQLYSYSLDAVWKYHPDEAEPRFRFGVEAGIAWVYGWESAFTPQPVTSSGGWFSSTSSNYRQDLVDRKTLGADLAAKIEYPLGRGFGVEAGAWSTLNSWRSMFGLELQLNFGKVRSRRFPRATR